MPHQRITRQGHPEERHHRNKEHVPQKLVFINAHSAKTSPINRNEKHKPHNKRFELERDHRLTAYCYSMNPFLLSLFGIISGSLLLTARAELRTFTNHEGKTIEAELIKADEATVVLRIKGGRLAKININTLSPADQAFIGHWIADKVPDVEITPDFDRGNSKNRSSSERNGNTQTFGFKVSIKNYSPGNTLEPCEIIYYLIGKSTSDATYKVLSRQIRETTVGPGETKLVRFESIQNQYADAAKTYEGEDTNHGYKGLGYVLHVQRKRDKRLIHLSSPATNLESVKTSIITLAEGDVTLADFVKIPEKPAEPEEPVKKKEPEVITIK